MLERYLHTRGGKKREGEGGGRRRKGERKKVGISCIQVKVVCCSCSNAYLLMQT